MASLLLKIGASGVARLASASRSGLGSVTVTVRSSTTVNWSGVVSEPVPSWPFASDFALTARSSDHLTSSAVTGVPSCHFASLSLNVMLRPSGLT